MTFLIAVISFIAALGPLIVFHELGHFLVARRLGVRVLRFSIGFGRPLVRWQRNPDATEWVLAAIPLGGFVAMLDEREIEPGRFTELELRRAFNRQSVWRRAAIVIAGPLANFLIAILVYWGVGLYGVQEPRPILGAPPQGTLAERAGVMAGDEVAQLGGSPVRSMIDLRWRLVKIAVDRGSVAMNVRTPAGADQRVYLDFGGFSDADLETDLLEHVGLVLASPPPILEQVTADGPAARAGLLSGDRILEVDGQAVANADQFRNRVQETVDQTVTLKVLRGQREIVFRLKPDAQPDPRHPGSNMGVIRVTLQPAPTLVVRYGFFDGFVAACDQTWDMTTFSVKMMGKMVMGEVSLKNLSGPGTMADFAGQAARRGWIVFVTFIAFISVSIGLMNLLPIPMLDGGHLLYYFVEIIKGRPPSERFLELSQRAGMVVLAGLMSVALFNDFSRLLF
ncbi:MAG: RIP metalloprotease RseP [Burkholderiaceae bacterium]